MQHLFIFLKLLILTVGRVSTILPIYNINFETNLFIISQNVVFLKKRGHLTLPYWRVESGLEGTLIMFRCYISDGPSYLGC